MPLQAHPLVQRIEPGLCALLPDSLALFGMQILDFALNVIDLAQLLQRKPGDLAFVDGVQIEELAPRVCQRAARGA